VAVAGTRGWLCPGHGLFGEEDERLYRREVGRLKVALESLEGRRSEFDTLIVALHFPPTNENHDASGFTDLIDQHRAAACVFGHLHGESISTALKGVRGETRYYIVSADAVGFEPAEIKVPQLKNG
jgi:predicted phosphohydrolase